MLEQNNYVVHEASYGSIIGQNTDIKDWYPKFRDHMDRILKTKKQDTLLSEGKSNNVILFKPCFPNNDFKSDDDVESAMNSYRQLLPLFEQHPDVLFVAVTAPPLVSPFTPKNIVKKLLGRYVHSPDSGQRARRFNNWLKDIKHGWLSQYQKKNVIVFDYFDVLTDKGKSNWSQYGSQFGQDSHPNDKGNRIAAQELVPFLNRAVRRANLSGPE